MEIKSMFGYILCISVVTSVYTAPTNPPRRRRTMGCRCKRVFKELNQVIDSKFRILEERLLKHLVIKDPAMPNASLQEITAKLSVLQQEVHQTQEALVRESNAILAIKDHVRAQSLTMDTLTNRFSVLENVVRNFTSLVQRSQGTVSDSQSLSSGISVANLRMPSPSSAPVSEVSRDQTEQEEDVTTQEPVLADDGQREEAERESEEGGEKDLTSESKTLPKHCHDVYRAGGLRYKGDYFIVIQPDGAPKPFKVVCKAEEDGGWTVLQRRQDGSVDFYRNWTDYKNGFGDMGGEFWLGNDYIHQITQQGNFKLRVDMETWNGEKYFAVYDSFRVDDETEQYMLHVSGYHGTAGDSLTLSRDNHDGMRFSTYNRDNDRRPYNNCAMHYRGGWWYNDCFQSNLNGQYYQDGEHYVFLHGNGVHWNSIHRHSSLKHAEMMVMPATETEPARNHIV